VLAVSPQQQQEATPPQDPPPPQAGLLKRGNADAVLVMNMPWSSHTLLVQAGT
jgi:hypothetical protein